MEELKVYDEQSTPVSQATVSLKLFDGPVLCHFDFTEAGKSQSRIEAADETDGICVVDGEISLKDRDVTPYPDTARSNKCYVKHSKSDKYLLLDGEKLHLHELQNKDERFVFEKGEAIGSEMNKNSCFHGETVTVMYFNDVIGAKDYVISTDEREIVAEELAEVEKDPEVIPSDTDPRYFFLRKTAGSCCCFISTKYQDYCLASDGEQLYLKKVTLSELCKDEHIQFEIFDETSE